jgi:hypothetical protein
MLLSGGATLLPAGAQADWLYEYDGQLEEAVYTGSFYQVPGQLGPLIQEVACGTAAQRGV